VYKLGPNSIGLRDGDKCTKIFFQALQQQQEFQDIKIIQTRKGRLIKNKEDFQKLVAYQKIEITSNTPTRIIKKRP